MKTLDRIFLSAALTAALLPVCNSAQASYPAGYYNSLEGKCGAELMQAIKALAEDHTVIDYGNSTWNAFKKTDVINIDGVDYWWDMYSNERVRITTGHNGLNIEHSVANSWWGGTKNAAYKDIVHLNPSDATANSKKSNYPLAEVGSVNWTNGVSTVGSPRSGQGGGASFAYEPADEYKGDFARAYMYIFTVYDDLAWKSTTNWMYDTNNALMFRPWAQTMLLRWSANDPVSSKETSRNDGIYATQHNRNPFIDFPNLADHIWGSKKTEPFSLTGGGGTTDPVELNQYSWLNEDDASIDWTFDDVNLGSGLTYVWSWKAYNGSHYLNASAYAGGSAKEALSYAWSPEISMKGVSAATVSFEHAAKFQTTLRTLCGFVVKNTETGEITELAIPTWPTAGSWTFANSGNIDLKQFAEKNIQIGLKYGSDSSGADTWEIRNMELTLERSTSDVQSLPCEEDDSFLVEVWGDVILAPAGARIFDLNGREYASGRNLQKGVYIVTKPTFEKAVKIIVK